MADDSSENDLIEPSPLRGTMDLPGDGAGPPVSHGNNHGPLTITGQTSAMDPAPPSSQGSDLEVSSDRERTSREGSEGSSDRGKQHRRRRRPRQSEGEDDTVAPRVGQHALPRNEDEDMSARGQDESEVTTSDEGIFNEISKHQVKYLYGFNPVIAVAGKGVEGRQTVKASSEREEIWLAILRDARVDLLKNEILWFYDAEKEMLIRTQDTPIAPFCMPRLLKVEDDHALSIAMDDDAVVRYQLDFAKYWDEGYLDGWATPRRNLHCTGRSTAVWLAPEVLRYQSDLTTEQQLLEGYRSTLEKAERREKELLATLRMKRRQLLEATGEAPEDGSADSEERDQMTEPEEEEVDDN
ncbi:hypothetical protein FRB90_012626 [Tulasnella sp. 427]|nr:hypothetical protein FRB90_012626 [Tulasnella sp. 427]